MSDLLKQAIADAKAVRATALSNAKFALEEQFAPMLQSMLSEKLRNELNAADGAQDNTDGNTGEEVGQAPAQQVPGEPDGDEAGQLGGPLDQPGAMGQVPEPVDGAPFGGDAPVGPDADAEHPIAPIGAAGQPATRAPSAPALDPTPMSGQEDERMEEIFGEDPQQSDLNHMNESDADYKKTTAGHKTADPGKKMVVKATSMSTKGSLPPGKKENTASTDYKKTATGNQIKNIKASGTEDPQGASNEVSDGLKKTDSGTSALKENDVVDEASLDEILKELEDSTNEVNCADPVNELDEEISLEEILACDDEAEQVTEGEGEVPPQFLKNIKKPEGDEGDEDDEDDKDDKDDKKTVKENISLKKELAEYRSAVVYLRDRINEVTLLNAKLLYTNKLFKQHSLNNEQKLRVIESFDLTKSVREAKLVYATLAESSNFGGKKTVVAPAPKKVMSQTVKTITEGLASKPVASTKPTNPAVLTEGAIMANRFQKLAGIRK
jgi:hypothetical protein